MEDDKNFCTLLISVYLNNRGTNIADVSKDILPDDFMASVDFELKNKILLEAIENNILINQTILYGRLQEKVLNSAKR